MATNIFEKVLENVDIADVVSKFVKLEPKGKNLFGICPFHDDTNPSMSVSRERGIYHCFVCKNGGNAIHFIEEYKHLSSLDACRYLAQEYRIDLSEFDLQKENKDKKYFDMASMSHKYFRYVMNDSNLSNDARKYLMDRGINEDTINEFEIGLSLNKSNALTDILRDKGYLDVDIEANGLSTGKNDTFIDRIIVPIKNEQGFPIAFGGRIYHGETNLNKYLNSKETPIFRKGEIIFNIDKAARELKNTNFLIINEGYMDVIQEYSKGIKNCVALMGTAMTSNQAKLIKKYTSNVCLILDGDNAGIKAVSSVVNRLEEQNINVSIVILKDNLDPDEFLRKYGRDEYIKYINENKIDKFTYFYYLTKLDYPTINTFNMESFKRAIFDLIKDVNSRSAIEVYLKKLSSDLKISYESVEQDFNYYTKGEKPKVDVKNEDSFSVSPASLKAEKMMIDYSIKNKKYFSRIEDVMDNRVFLHDSTYRNMFIEIGDIYDEYPNIELNDLIDELKVRGVYNEYVFDSKIEFSMDDLNNNVIKSFNKIEIKNKINELKVELLNGNASSIRSKEIQLEILNLNKELKK